MSQNLSDVFSELRGSFNEMLQVAPFDRRNDVDIFTNTTPPPNTSAFSHYTGFRTDFSCQGVYNQRDKHSAVNADLYRKLHLIMRERLRHVPIPLLSSLRAELLLWNHATLCSSWHLLLAKPVRPETVTISCPKASSSNSHILCELRIVKLLMVDLTYPISSIGKCVCVYMLCTAYSTPISHDGLQLLSVRVSLLNLWNQTRGCSKMMVCCLQCCGWGVVLARASSSVRTTMSHRRRLDRLPRFPPRDAIETT